MPLLRKVSENDQVPQRMDPIGTLKTAMKWQYKIKQPDKLDILYMLNCFLFITYKLI